MPVWPIFILYLLTEFIVLQFVIFSVNAFLPPVREVFLRHVGSWNLIWSDDPTGCWRLSCWDYWSVILECHSLFEAFLLPKSVTYVLGQWGSEVILLIDKILDLSWQLKTYMLTLGKPICLCSNLWRWLPNLLFLKEQ